MVCPYDQIDEVDRVSPISLQRCVHWCLKSIKSGFAIAIVAGLENHGVLSERIDTKKLTDGTLQDTKENA